MAVVKISVNLPQETVDALKALSAKRKVTMTEVLRDAITTEAYLDRLTANNAKLLVEQASGEIQQIVFMR